MKTCKTWLAALVVVATLTSAQSVRAITYGELDKGRHPNVGAVMFRDHLNPDNPVAMCFSGTLIAPRVFLTAGHCTDPLEWSDLQDYYVTFADNPFDQTKWLAISDVRTHPGYNPAKPTSEDVGVAILDEEVTAITPAKLPDVGFLDKLKDLRELTRDSKFLAVGYGSHATFSPPKSVYEEYDREMVMSGYMSLGKRWLNLSMNPKLGNGGGGYGDSGGPRFWINPDDNNSEHLVAITSRGDPELVALDATYRIDTPMVLDFLKDVIQ